MALSQIFSGIPDSRLPKIAFKQDSLLQKNSVLYVSH